MAPDYSECTWSVCVCFAWFLVIRFREMCTDWRDFGAYLAAYLAEQQLPLYSTSRIIEVATADRTMTILQNENMHIYIYIYIYIYIAFLAQCIRKGRVCL